MINKDDLVSLSYEQKLKFRAAIDYGYFDNYEDNPREWKHTFVGTFLWKHPGRTATIRRLEKVLGRVPTWGDLDNDFLRDVVDDFLESEIAESSAKTMCAELKAILNANKKKIPSDDFGAILSIRGTKSQAVYLTRNEMQAIIDYVPVSNLERYVKRNFVVEMLTGARLCDAAKLTLDNCNPETGILSYVPKKTPGVVVSVPVDERMKLRNFLADRYRRTVCTDTFNDTIRRICRECRINTVCSLQRKGKNETAEKWRLVSSHTARRSFATNLYLAGVSLEDIAVLMGHGKNIETTKRYICAERKISSNVMSYFQPPEEE